LNPTAHPHLSDAAGSFRDPQGRVVIFDSRIFRALFRPAAPFPDTWNERGPLAPLVAAGKIWPSLPRLPSEVPTALTDSLPGACGFLEHPALSPITYPYEWPFQLLKRAALLHLEVHRSVLDRGLTLADGSAFNVQFVGTRPVFLDALAFVPYVESQAWAGYSQFCESFLNPLLLAARGSDAWIDLYRGSMRGVTTREVARQLGLFGALRAGVTLHVYVQSLVGSNLQPVDGKRRSKSSRAGLDLMLRGLQKTISALELPQATRSEWFGYEQCNSYSESQRTLKHSAVREFVSRCRPQLLLDLGSNAGEYAAEALTAGASRVVGFERDAGALHQAVTRGDALDERYLPLQIDLLNPSPAQGWNLEERTALTERVKADAVLCLALVHHLVLGAGVPLAQALRGIVRLAPKGLVEFVPPDDPMARRISGSEERLRHEYNLEAFRAVLASIADIGREIRVTDGRTLFEYTRPR
jgi:hypothetical protein